MFTGSQPFQFGFEVKRFGNHGTTLWVQTVIQMGYVYHVTDRVYCLMMETENIFEA
jgi:hypothetical protein